MVGTVTDVGIKDTDDCGMLGCRFGGVSSGGTIVGNFETCLRSNVSATFLKVHCIRSPFQNFGMFVTEDNFKMCMISWIACFITPASFNFESGVRWGMS